MYRFTGWITSFLVFLIFVASSFTMDELKFINYEVDISVTPVKREKTNHPVVYITSKSGQEFQCLLPQLSEEEMSEKEVENEKDMDVLKLLKPMKTGSCLSKGKDWWTYEFCFGHYIKQFHIEDGQIIGQVITLGLYESDFDWKNETNKEKFRRTKQRYHSQYYSNGSKCDLTGEPRNAEVRIYCAENAGDYIYRVDEPGTCSYIVTVHTSRVCSHPLLKPLLSSKPHSITCHPLLSEEQYTKYLQKLNEKNTLADGIKRRLWPSNQQDKLQDVKSEDISDDENPSFDTKTQNIKSARKNYEVARAFLLQEYDKEIEKMKTALLPQKLLVIKNSIRKHFENMLNEARKSDPREAARDVDLSKFILELNTLLRELDKDPKTGVKATQEGNEARSVFSDVYTSDSADNDALKDYENLKAGDENVKDGDENVNDGNENLKGDENKELFEDNVKVASGDQSQTEFLDDDKLQVRIRRLDRKSSDANGKLHEMDFEQRKKLEQAVKEKLEKAGLDTGGRRIEVKIITAGYYDNEDGKDFQSLTDEETDQFQNMIMALLTGQQEAVQEMKRYKKLEENYKFTWVDNEEIDKKED